MSSTFQEQAEFSTVSRLLSCLVTESLTPGFYVPLYEGADGGHAMIMKSGASSDKAPRADEILAIVPLHHAPIFRPDQGNEGVIGIAIGLLDPLDMIPLVFDTGANPAGLEPDVATPEYTVAVSSALDALRTIGAIEIQRDQIFKSTDPLSIWDKFALSIDLDKDIQSNIANEFSSSIKWQAHAYEFPPEAPSFSSPSIVWEQSIVEGHPTHPMHKTRRFFPPLEDYLPGSYDLLHPRLRFVSISRNDAKITYDFENLILPVLRSASIEAGKDLTVEEDRVVIPVHELQVIHIQDKFPEAYIYPEEFNVPLLAQQSLRSVIVPAYHGLHLKLAVGFKLTSSLRIISPEAAYLGPRFSAKVVPKLTMDKSIVTVARELASIVHSHPEGRWSHRKTLCCDFCSSLTERGHTGENGHLPSVIRVFELDTEEKRAQWLEKFVALFLQALLPPALYNGVTFYCHAQNCLARFDMETKELKGFVIRDFGGLRFHLETLKAATGIELDCIQGHACIAETLDDVYKTMYHTTIRNLFQQLIRALDLHYNGRGWAIVRDQLEKQIPEGHPLYDAWLSPDRKTVAGKCFLRMSMAPKYTVDLHRPFPNLINFKGSK